MKKLLLILTFILLSSISYSQDSNIVTKQDSINDIEPVLIDKKISHFETVEDLEKGSIYVYYDIFFKGEVLTRATIHYSYNNYYMVEEYIFKNKYLVYFTSKKIQNGRTEHIIEVNYSTNEIILDGITNTKKEIKDSILETIDYRLAILASIIYKQ